MNGYPLLSPLPPVLSQTFSQREKRQQLLEKRKALLDVRLAKVRRRKLKKLGMDDDGGVDTPAKNLTDFDFDMHKKNSVEDGAGGVMGGERSEVSALLAAELSLAQETARREEEEREEEKRAAHVRPWDKGKGNCG